MKKRFIIACVGFVLLAFSSFTMAQSDSYFATGEDLDFLIESDNTLAIRELEYELRQFSVYRSIEDFVMTLTDQYIEENN